jgi:hypothetical protein
MNKPDAPENGMNPDAQEGYAVPASQDHHSELVQFLSAVLEDCLKIFKEKRSSFSTSPYKIFITKKI